jgi:hypothetical protein
VIASSCRGDTTLLTGAGARLCVPYRCDAKAAACLTSCASDGDCTGGFVCTQHVCGGPVPGVGGTTCDCRTAPSGFDGASFAAALGAVAAWVGRRAQRRFR